MYTPSRISPRTKDGVTHRYIKGSNVMYSPIERARAQYAYDYNSTIPVQDRKHTPQIVCPKGEHVSYRTASGMLREMPKCVRGSRMSLVPDLYTAAMPRYKYGSRCRKGYARNSKGSCSRAWSKAKKTKKRSKSRR